MLVYAIIEAPRSGWTDPLILGLFGVAAVLVNGDLGIRAVEDVTNGGGNVARRNGDSRQCVNISCD